MKLDGPAIGSATGTSTGTGPHPQWSGATWSRPPADSARFGGDGDGGGSGDGDNAGVRRPTSASVCRIAIGEGTAKGAADKAKLGGGGEVAGLSTTGDNGNQAAVAVAQSCLRSTADSWR